MDFLINRGILALHICEIMNFCLLFPGNAGNVLDGYNPPTKRQSSSEESDSEGETGDDTPLLSSSMISVPSEAPKWQSTTPAMKAVTRDKCYYHMPFYEEKPCVYIKSNMEDHRRRLYNVNIIEKIVEKLVCISWLLYTYTCNFTKLYICKKELTFFMPPAWKVRQGYLVIGSCVCPSICLSVCP